MRHAKSENLSDGMGWDFCSRVIVGGGVERRIMLADASSCSVLCSRAELVSDNIELAWSTNNTYQIDWLNITQT